ncbi:MAG: hypothetical protein OEU54_08215 [Gemmatimonadota bacterium]|nr:hypothetical protein [Gemmatimonadota bacterium]
MGRAVAMALVGVLASSPLLGQSAGMLVLEAPASTESMAYGNAPYLFSASPSLIFYAPGLIETTAGVDASLQRYASEGTLASAAAAGSVFGGGFAIGIQYMRYGTAEFPTIRDVQSQALTEGSIGVSEFVGTIGYARTILGIRTGATLKFAEQSGNATRESGAAFDLGLAKDVGPVMISLAGRNFGGDVTLSPGPEGSQDVTLELPRQYIAGVSVDDFEVGPLDMFLTSQVIRRRDGEYIPAGGVELSYWPVAGYTFRLRGGLQRVAGDDRSPFTYGAAFTGDDITIEYAFQAFDGEGNGHRIGLRWR